VVKIFGLVPHQVARWGCRKSDGTLQSVMEEPSGAEEDDLAQRRDRDVWIALNSGRTVLHLE